MNRCPLAVPVGHPIREYPDWIQAALPLDDRLGHGVQHDQPFLSVLHTRSLVPAAGMRSLKSRAASAFQAEGAGASSGGGRGIQGNVTQSDFVDATSSATAQPAWARRLQRRQQISHAATTVAHMLRGGDGGGSGSGPSLRDSDS